VCVYRKHSPTQHALFLKHISHSRTVVRECFKGDEASQWKRPKFNPSPHRNPFTKIGKRDYVLNSTRRAKFCSDRFRGFCSAPQIRDFAVPFNVTSFYVRFLGSSIRLQPTPLNRFLRKILQNTSFRVRKCLLGVPMIIFYI